MKFQEQKSSGQEKDEASIELLRQLTRKLCSSDISTARLAAFNLSAYGLRSMKGRMRKMASEVLEQGLKHRDRTTKAACVKALFLMKGGTGKKGGSHSKSKSGKQRIQGIRKPDKRKTEWDRTSPSR